MISLCNHWEFTREWVSAFALGEGQGESVRIPHSVARPLSITPITGTIRLSAATAAVWSWVRNWRDSGCSCSLTGRPTLPPST